MANEWDSDPAHPGPGWIKIGPGAYTSKRALDKLRKQLYVQSILEKEKVKTVHGFRTSISPERR